ncbi:hypothetical protein DiNV_CH01M_ORF12 [Drosophila innubila nudivirus]|uniref:Uncharacterized protein n=1 Tax=Drosophila innubila nudivirus TaxID=2057187 RepID=A0A2H4UX59_9VIRU|nr:hypothetical protein DiNV_CH01M_ORF12 [Drosophila innubila nudivirus]ATZ81494.1 hypothetical protein DiNV_CH01M_ORF12 [Drosophila innubila nudivirus]
MMIFINYLYIYYPYTFCLYKKIVINVLKIFSIANTMDNNARDIDENDDFNHDGSIDHELICDENMDELDDLPNDSDTCDSIELSSSRTLDANANAPLAYSVDNVQNKIGTKSNDGNNVRESTFAALNIQQCPQLSDACASIFKSLATIDVQSFQQAIKYSIFAIFVLIVTIYLFPKHLLLIILYILLLALCLLKYIVTPMTTNNIATARNIPRVQNKQRPIDIKKLELLRKKLLKNTIVNYNTTSK